MTTPRAYDEITLTHGPHAVRLVPSLRAATYLESLHDGFPNLLRKVQQFDTRTIAAIITASADKEAAQNLFIYAATEPLSAFRDAAQGPAIELIAALLPQSKETPDTPANTTTTPQPWSKVFADLFGFATGWLGWTPDTAWKATPQEITDAFSAHIDMLKAIHGGADEDADTTPTYTPERQKQIEEQGFDPAFDRAGLMSLSDMGSLR